uniref:Maltoporin n=1 Tax=Steinernema glaseri TaxID=37863 RepID=A0A1I8AVC5_9BILA
MVTDNPLDIKTDGFDQAIHFSRNGTSLWDHTVHIGASTDRHDATSEGYYKGNKLRGNNMRRTKRGPWAMAKWPEPTA